MATFHQFHELWSDFRSKAHFIPCTFYNYLIAIDNIEGENSVKSGREPENY
jgi:hypothetical protein